MNASDARSLAHTKYGEKERDENLNLPLNHNEPMHMDMDNVFVSCMHLFGFLLRVSLTT